MRFYDYVRPVTAINVLFKGRMVSACEAGFGLIQVPVYHVTRQLAAGTLVELLPDFRPPPLPLTVLYPQNRHLSPRVRVFVDWLAELFQGP